MPGLFCSRSAGLNPDWKSGSFEVRLSTFVDIGKNSPQRESDVCEGRQSHFKSPGLQTRVSPTSIGAEGRGKPYALQRSPMTDEHADTNPFPQWLEEVANDSLTVDISQEGLLSECRENLRTFSISQSQAEVTTVEDVLNFLSGIMQARERQINARSGPTNPMIFYCWFDEQASQLRFSLVSTWHNRLPFGALVEETDDFAKVVSSFLGNRHHNGIPLDEFMTQEEANKQNLPETPPDVLLVATKTLPTN